MGAGESVLISNYMYAESHWGITGRLHTIYLALSYVFYQKLAQ